MVACLQVPVATPNFRREGLQLQSTTDFRTMVVNSDESQIPKAKLPTKQI